MYVFVIAIFIELLLMYVRAYKKIKSDDLESEVHRSCFREFSFTIQTKFY